MAKLYYDKDADLKHLKGMKIAIIGYGSQGHAQAQNLRDSGVEVIVSDLKGTDNFKLAQKHGFSPMAADEAAKKADIIHMLVPDEFQAKIYNESIAPQMKKGKALVFSHGFNIHYQCIQPAKEIDVWMVAPKGPGHLVRAVFESGGGVPCLIAVYQDASGKAKARSLAHAKGVGGTRAGVLETTYREETETDLFGEQVILCGGLTALVKAAFETLVEAGYQPESAYFECMHELKLIVDLMYQGGMAYMRYSISNTAEYGDYTRGPRIVTEQTKAAMKECLKEIQDGSFAREWILENLAGRPHFLSLRRQGEEHLVEKVGKEMRDMMPWLKKK